MTTHQTNEPMRCYLGIGSNQHPDRHIPQALLALTGEFGRLTPSSIYQSAPLGGGGDDFVNLVVGFDSDLPATEIVKRLKQIENKQGRLQHQTPSQGHTLDLDLLLYGDAIIDELKIPRKDIECYAFVLEPLAEIAPDLRHPVSRMTMQTLWANFDKTGLRQHSLAPAWLPIPAHSTTHD